MTGLPLEQRVAIVTGGAGGIGLATARALRQQGACVVIADLRQALVDAALASLRDDPALPGECDGVEVDVTREDSAARMADHALRRFGRIDLLVCAAGILRASGSAPKPLVQMSVQEWDAVIDVNLRGTFLANRAVLPAMMARRSGHVINLSSLSGRQGHALDSAYCASKFGVIGLTESIAEEVARYGVKATVVLPDVVDTKLWEQNGPVPRPEAILSPERVADLIVYLATMPDDTVLVGPVLAAARGRRPRPMPRRPDGERDAADPPRR